MSKGFWIALVAVVLLAVLAEWAKPPPPPDWTLSLQRGDARPYGAEAAFRLLQAWHPDVRAVRSVPFVALAEADALHQAGDRDAARALDPDAYVFLTEFFLPDPAETDRLLRYAERGGTLFVGAMATDAALADTLGVEAWGSFDPFVLDPTVFDQNGSVFELGADSVLALAAPSLAREGGFVFGQPLSAGYLEGVGGTAGRADEVLGRVVGADQDTVFARVPYGEGQILFHAAPVAFTNVHLLDREHDGAAYAAAVFAYLPDGAVWWDAHHKPGRTNTGDPLQFVRADPSLRWALWLSGIGLVAFVLLRGRRWQRAVPEVRPPLNQHARYAEAVGQLRFERAESPAAVLAARRAAFRRRLAERHLDPGPFGPDDAVRLARRLHLDPDDVRRLFLALTRPNPDAEHLLAAERLAERFLAQSDPDRPAAAPPPERRSSPL